MKLARAFARDFGIQHTHGVYVTDTSPTGEGNLAATPVARHNADEVSRRLREYSSSAWA